MVKAVRQALAQQTQVPLEAVRVTLSPGSTLVHVQILTPNMQMASRVATLSAKAGGRSLLNNINSHLTEAQLEQVNPAVGGASFRLKVISQKDADDAQDMPRRVRSDSDDSKKASRVEGPRGRPEETKLIMNSKIEAIYASMRAAGKMIMHESPASTKPSTDDTRGSQPVPVLCVCCSDPKRLSLAGSYRAVGQLYGRPSFRKERGQHCIHYWKEPDDPELCGWWFSDKDGLLMAFHKDTGTRPPKTGWSIPTLSLRTFEPKKGTWKP